MSEQVVTTPGRRQGEGAAFPFYSSTMSNLNKNKVDNITMSSSISSSMWPTSPCPVSTNTSTSTGSGGSDWSFSTRSSSVTNSSKKKYTFRLDRYPRSRNKSRSMMAPVVPPSPSRTIVDPEYAQKLNMWSINNHSLQKKHQKQKQTADFQLMPPPGIDRGAYTAAASQEAMSPNVFSTPSASSAEMEESISNLIGSSYTTDYHTPEQSLTTTPVRKGPYSLGKMNTSSTAISPSTVSSRYYSSFSPSPKSTKTYENFTSPTNKNVTPVRMMHQKRPDSAGHNNSTPRKGKRGLSSSGHNHPHSDRFIPSRVTSNLNFSVWGDRCDSNENKLFLPTNISNNDGSATGMMPPSHTEEGNDEVVGQGDASQSTNTQTTSPQQSHQPPLFNELLRSELLGENADPVLSSPVTSSGMVYSNASGVGGLRNSSHSNNSLRDAGNFLRYVSSPRRSNAEESFRNNQFNNPENVVNNFNLSPVGSNSRNRLLSVPQKRKRRIAKVPFKVLDAPSLADDFYLNLVDWSSLNVLAVGLGSSVYLWSACTSKVTKLCDLSELGDGAVTSVAWTQRGAHLAVGVHNGEVQIWDTVKCMKIRAMGGHSARIGTLSWNGPIMASGSRDRLIYLRDVRVQQPFTARLAAHRQEVCGLKWSFDEPAQLASGGNDNKLLIWDIKNYRQPVHRFAAHTAAVKAIAWSPHQHGLLASGGGTADRCIRFWNSLSGSEISCIDTGSQVCNLAWSKNCNELVSTHGYSLNQVVVWKYPTMQKVATLTGHTYRVLYLALSPDGSTIVTGAGDETLRFWQVFPGPQSQDKNAGNGLLFPSSPGSVLR